ncbi:MAG: CPBP family intramembrane metalloprotease [Candidatus Gastranaerophilales bacterium]|nr:CPBP family intramembrane metalloprotease [Candidatus Gastranaerophilales bacterium]
MKNFWKKVGWLALAVLPVVASFALQIVLVFAVVFLDGIMVGIQMANTGVMDAEQMTLHVMQTMTDSLTIVTACYQAVGLVMCATWYYYGCGRPKLVSPKKIFTGKGLAATLLIGFGMCVAATGLLSSAEFIVPDVIQQYEELMEAAGLGSDPLIIIVSVLIAPIGEELMCRGIIFHYAGKVVKGMRSKTAAFWIANAIQALMFGVMHGNLVQGFYAFLMGLGLGWLRGRYRSLYPSMLAHFVINFSSTFILGFLFAGLPETLPVCAAIMLVGIVITVLVMCWASAETDRKAEA